MRHAEILEAENEAKRFLSKVNMYKAAHKAGLVDTVGPSKERASVKRSSLDLTRSLAQMRKSITY